MKIIVDGNGAVSRVAYLTSEVAGIYPITPSSPMAENFSVSSLRGETNIFGDVVKIVEMQSEAGAAGFVHGSLLAGSLTTTFTSSQGLLLMIPNMFKIAGEQLPFVMNVSARSVATHALNIFGDHSDVMAARQTGFCMVASSSVQECFDHALVCAISSVDAQFPFMHFFDGFRTSHEIQKIDVLTKDEISSIFPFERMKDFKARALNPLSPCQMGTAQNGDVFFQNREKANVAWNANFEKIEKAMRKVSSLTGRALAPFVFVGSKDAEHVIVVMGSGADVACEVARKLVEKGEKVGVLKVCVFKPFGVQSFLEKIPKTAKVISVLDRTKESTTGEPLFLEVVAAFRDAEKSPKILRGRFGLGGKNFSQGDVVSVFENSKSKEPKQEFTVGIDDDVSHLSLTSGKFDGGEECFAAKIFGLGSDGSVGLSKNIVSIIGESTNNFVQGFFEYDSKKSGSLTVSHLRFSKSVISNSSLVEEANFVCCGNSVFLSRFDALRDLKDGGVFLLNADVKDVENLPQSFLRGVVEKKVKLFVVDASGIAMRNGLKGKTSSALFTAFFEVLKDSGLFLLNGLDSKGLDDVIVEKITKSFLGKGDDVVERNVRCAACGKAVVLVDVEGLIAKGNNSKAEVMEDFENSSVCKGDCKGDCQGCEYSRGDIVSKILGQEGGTLPVSCFDATGRSEVGTSCLEKRSVAENIPFWKSEICIQCGLCAQACPHGCLRPVVASDEELKERPLGCDVSAATGFPSSGYRMQVMPRDCTGCEVCKNVCPLKNKAIEMMPFAERVEIEEKNCEFLEKVEKKENTMFSKLTPKGLQFEKPYFEFSGACAGCGETPYVKSLSQLFGENLVIANATGCSSIYGGSFPSCPYVKDENGHGTSWANSLFEDNAEFGLGMRVSFDHSSKAARKEAEKFLACDVCDESRRLLKIFCSRNLSCFEVERLVECSQSESEEFSAFVLRRKNDFVRKSVWIIGGDGWAYDIGYGGLDHVLSSGENVNVLVLDTEIYSNTGGQSSKSTPLSASAKFCENGKRTKKKNLAALAIVQKNCFVASVSLGANPVQLLKALDEAEKFEGPSLVIAYCPCVLHGFNMSGSNAEMKKAVECGHWNLFRFDPSKKEPLQIDTLLEPNNMMEFLKGENRFKKTMQNNPDAAKKLFEDFEAAAFERYDFLKMVDFWQHEK